MHRIVEDIYKLLFKDFGVSIIGGYKIDELKKSIEKLDKTETRLASLKWSLLRGIFSGLGFFLGSVALAAIIIYILSFLDTAPVISDILDRLEQR